MMDLFLRDIHIVVFRKWVYFQFVSNPDVKIELYDERTYKIYYQDKIARFVVWPIGIIEEAIFENGKLLFYLHYQFNNLYFAKVFFEKMVYKLYEKQAKKRNILLCCSGGMTTGYFAQKINRCCRLNHLPYHVDATAQYQLEKVYKNYDLILLAPQLRYKSIELASKLDFKKVLNIDSKTFATYNCQDILKVIEDYFKGEEKT